MIQRTYSKPVIWTLFILFSIVWFYTLGLRTLVPTDEGRYAEMAREMLASGDWITTRLNGIKYFEKPPLQTWMNALTFYTFGLGEWQARLWTGLCGFFGIILVGITGTKLAHARVGILASLILASSFLWAALGHINTLDMGLSAMMTLTLCALLIAQRDAATVQERRYWMCASWAGMALAVLSKGLIGIILPGAVLVLYSVFSRDYSIWKRLHLGKGLALFLLITAPWFILVSIHNPEFPHFFFIHEHVERFLLKTHHREGPWYYFIPLLILGIFPWFGALFQSLRQSYQREPHQRFQYKHMLLIWSGFIFLFFSVSSSKLPSYIVPIFPALALMLAITLDTAKRTTWMLIAGVLILTGAIGAGFAHKVSTLSSSPLEIPLYQAYQPWVMATALTLLVGGLSTLAALRGWAQYPTFPSLVVAICGFATGQILMLGHEPLGRYAAGVPLVKVIQHTLTPDTKLYSVGQYDQAIPFYLQRTMTLVESPDELEFGLKQEPNLWIPTRAAFIEQWRTTKKAIAIVRPDIYRDLRSKNIPMRILTQDTRRIVITNIPL